MTTKTPDEIKDDKLIPLQPLNEIIEIYRKKWGIVGNNVWWQEPFKKCYIVGFSLGVEKGKKQMQEFSVHVFKKEGYNKACEDIMLEAESYQDFNIIDLGKILSKLQEEQQ